MMAYIWYVVHLMLNASNEWVNVWHSDKLIAEDVKTVAELKIALDPYMGLINEQNKN